MKDWACILCNWACASGVETEEVISWKSIPKLLLRNLLERLAFLFLIVGRFSLPSIFCTMIHNYAVNMRLINEEILRNLSSKKVALLFFFFSLPTPGEVVEDGLSCTVFALLDRMIDSCWAFEQRTIFKNS